MIFAALGALLASTAAAQTPAYEPGAVFVYDNGRVEHVRAVEGERVVWAARSGRTYVRDANPIVPILEWGYRGRVGERRVLGDPDALWPLRAGKRVRFQTVNRFRDEDGGGESRSLHLWSCSVRALERVSTPAGAFDSFPIQCDRFSPSSMRVIERLTWWYAPDVGHYVRRAARNMGDGRTETFSLFAALPPRESNVVRIEALARRARAAGGD